MDVLMSFFQERWMMIVGAVVLLLLIVKLVKTAVKWVLVLALLFGVGYYAYQYAEEWKTFGGSVMTGARQEVVNMLLQSVGDAQYRENPDGTFSVMAGEIEVQGQPGSNEVRITFKGQTFTLELSGGLRAFLEKVKEQAQSKN